MSGTSRRGFAIRVGLVSWAALSLLAASTLTGIAPRLVFDGQMALDLPAFLLIALVAAGSAVSALMAAASSAPRATPLILATLAALTWALAACSLDLASAAVLWGAGWILAAAAMGRAGGPERLEAAVKVQGLGAASALILVLGAALASGLAGSTHLLEAGYQLAARPDSHVLALASARVVLVGIALAAAWVPFHFWAPDALGAGPRPVALVFALAAPLAASLALARVLLALDPTLQLLQVNWRGGLFAFAALTGAVGGSVALVQRDAARLTAYLTVVQCAELFPALVAEPGEGRLWMRAAIAHGVALAPAWLALAAWSEASGEATDWNALSGRGRRVPLQAFLWVAALALAAGFPGGVRFLARPEMARAAPDPWLWALLLALSTLLQWAAVVRLARVLFLQGAADWTGASAPPSRGARAWPAWIVVALAIAFEIWFALAAWRPLFSGARDFGLLPGG